MTKLFFFSILAMLSLTLHAQHFDWATSYSGYPGNSDTDNPGNKILSTVADRDGNVYILGECFPGSQINGVDLLPRDVVTGYPRSLVIAKINPDGNLMWHKTISGFPSSNGGDVYGNCMRLIGDSSLMVLCYFSLPYTTDYSYRHLYYIDSLYTDAEGLMSVDSVGDRQVTCLVTLDLNGNKTEDHFLQMSALDTTGSSLYARPNYNKINVCSMLATSFDVDKLGNIYIGRTAGFTLTDYIDGEFLIYSFANRNIGTQRIVVDGINSLYWTPNPEPYGHYQIIKFSPHFENILNATFVFDSTDRYSDLFFINDSTPYETNNAEVNSMDLDEQGNLYLTLHCLYPDSRMPLANSDTLAMTASNIEMIQSAMIKYDSSLTPLYIAQLHSTPETNPEANPSNIFHFTTTLCDEESNSVYIGGKIQRRSYYNWGHSPAAENQVMYGNDTIDMINSMFWLRLDRDNGQLISYGKAYSEVATEMTTLGSNYPKCHISVQNGIVAATVKYHTSMDFADMSYITESEDVTLCLWDENGNELKCADFNVDEAYSTTGQVIGIDDAVYVTGIAFNSVQCGDIELPATGHSQAYIVKYSDTIFGTVPGTTERLPQHITWEQELDFTAQPSPIALNAYASSGLPVHYTSSDPDVAYIDGDRLFFASEGDATVTATQPGNYIYLAAEPVTKTVTTPSGHTPGGEGIQQAAGGGQQAAVSVYPNPASGRVRVVGADGFVNAIEVLDMQGRKLIATEGTDIFDVSSLPAGQYIVRVTTDDSVHYLKLIKK